MSTDEEMVCKEEKIIGILEEMRILEEFMRILEFRRFENLKEILIITEEFL